MSAPVRIGIVGAGIRRARRRARCSRPPTAARSSTSCRRATTPRCVALCARADLDLVAVHSPPFLHPAHVDHALDAGHAVLCDKPFGRNAEDAATMLAAQRRGRAPPRQLRVPLPARPGHAA